MRRYYITLAVGILFRIGDAGRCAAVEPATTAAADIIGKTVEIKTAKGGQYCIRLENLNPKIALFDKASPDACLFKVEAGSGPNTICFESAQNPGLFLRHFQFHLTLLKGAGDDASFIVEKPLRGNMGLSLASFNYPTFHLVITEKGQLDVAKEIKDPRKAVFFLEEPAK